VAVELSEALLSKRPDLADCPEAVGAWARVEAMTLLYADYHARVGTIDQETGDLPGGARVLAAEKLAAQLRQTIGLDLVSEAQLQPARTEAVASVVDLQAIRERGRAVLARRRTELAVLRDDAETIDAETVEEVATDGT
jgi:hypothetical protein